MKILALYKPAHQNPPTPEMMAKMNAFIDELTKAGKLIATEGRKAGGLEVKIRMRKGQLSVTDGPFTEAKELVGRFARRAHHADEALPRDRRRRRERDPRDVRPLNPGLAPPREDGLIGRRDDGVRLSHQPRDRGGLPHRIATPDRR